MTEEVQVFKGVICCDRDLDVGVESLKLIEGSLGPVHLADVLRPNVEVLARILDCHNARVVESHLLGASEDQVLGHLDSELHDETSTPEIPWIKTLRAISLP